MAMKHKLGSAERKRLFNALPGSLAIVLYGTMSHAWWTALVLAALAISSLIRFPRLGGSSLLVGVVAFGTCTLLAIFLPQEWLQASSTNLSELSSRTAFGLLLYATLRLFMARPFGGKSFHCALLVGVAVASGQGNGSWIYPSLSLLVLIAMAIYLMGERDGGPALSGLDRRSRRWVMAGGFVGASVTLASFATLPVLHAQVIRYFYDWERRGSTTGVGDDILLGGAADISQSNELVLRVHGPRPDLLRGVVFHRYRNGRWVPGEVDPGKPILLSGEGPPGSTRVEATKTGPRYFMPLQAKAVASPPGLVLIDRMGTLRAPAGSAADTLSFVLDTSVTPPILPPTAEDLELPEAHRSSIQNLATSWTEGKALDEERLDALRDRLHSDFHYSLRHERRTSKDPIVDFLEHQRVGHCEYFASGMALLSRSLGIPARVVSGFRVHERNPVGGFHVVRARDAHAWVEAWVDGRWETFDPTPPGALEASDQNVTPWFRGLWDWWQDRWDKMDGTQVRLILFVGVAALAGLLALVLWLRRWHRERHFGEEKDTAPLVPNMAALLADLDLNGWPRPASETLESFSRRLRMDDEERLISAADLVECYAQLIYGGGGSAEELESKIGIWLKPKKRSLRELENHPDTPTPRHPDTLASRHEVR